MNRARYVLAIAIALFAILTLLDRFALLETLVRRITVPLLFALAEAIAMVGVGALVRRAQRIDIILDFLLGYPLFGALCFLVALLEIATWTMVAALVLGAALLLRGAGRWPAVSRAAGPPAAEPAAARPASGRPYMLALLLLFLCLFVVAQAPPASSEEIAIPRAWALEGRAIELPLLPQSYSPLGIESASLPPLAILGAIDGGIAAHFLHLFAAIATTLLIARRTSSWLATAAIVTTPALVDWPLAGLFVALYVALEDGDRETASAATASGLLASYLFLPFALGAWILKRSLPKWTAVFGLLLFARTLILGGGLPQISGSRALELASYVFDRTLPAEALGASILTLPVFATGGIALASLGLAIAFFFFGPAARHLVPFLVVPSVSAAPALRRRVLAFFVAIAVVIQTLLIVWLTAQSGAFSLLTGTSAQEYLRKTQPSYASIEWLNQVLPAHSRTLLVGSSETYWFARPVRGGPGISRYLDLPTPEALRERFRADGITHVAILTTEHQPLSPNAQRTLAQTLDHYAASVTSRGNATVFTLK